MSTRPHLVADNPLRVGDCICLHLQRAARAVARRFDDAFRPLSLTSGQFSLMFALTRMDKPSIGAVATVLAMDRTTLTANLKPLERDGFIKIAIDKEDRRGRHLTLTPSGRALLATALPIWRKTHADIDRLLSRPDPATLREGLRALS